MTNVNLKQEDKMFELYTLAELAYKKHFENSIGNEEYIFPESWYENKNYKLKVEILKESIQNNILIEKNPKYLEIVEGGVNILVK